MKTKKLQIQITLELTPNELAKSIYFETDEDLNTFAEIIDALKRSCMNSLPLKGNFVNARKGQSLTNNIKKIFGA